MAAKVRTARVNLSTSYNNGSCVLDFSIVDGEEFLPKPGQYIIVNTQVNQSNGKPAKRAYTLIPSDVPGRYALSAKTVADGPGGAYINSLKQGDEFLFGGPYGKFQALSDYESEDVTAIATDTGITAILGLSSKLTKSKSKRLLWLVPSKDYFIDDNFVEQKLEGWIVEKRIVSEIGDPNRGQSVLDTAADFIARGTAGVLYICGDGAVVEGLKKQAITNGKIDSRIKVEYFFNKPKTPDDTAKKGMREGYTTGACSAAAAKAATRSLIHQEKLSKIQSILPNGRAVTFDLVRCTLEEEFAQCVVIKDGGDDPDCTHGAEICATVRLLNKPEIIITGGTGVAKVTRPGLGLDVGTHAINPVPRQNITDMVRDELNETEFMGASVEISIPDGEERSKQTLNKRLGLLGGLSILGTTGIVKPYSTSAFIASVVQSIQLAAVDGCETVVFTTGSRSENFAMKIRSDLRESSFIQVGDYIGIAIRNTVRQRIPSIHIVGMFGKLSKMADGKMMTHASGSEVNMVMLSDLAREAGASEELCGEILKANTARHVWELTAAAKLSQYPTMICERVIRAVMKFARADINLDVTLVDFGGKILASSYEHRSNISILQEMK